MPLPTLGAGPSALAALIAAFFDFDSGLATFTAKMAKRLAPGPFTAAPIVQGDWDTSGTGDVLSFQDGDVISGNFKANADSVQGTIVLWITPEWNGDDGLTHHILISSNNNPNCFKLTDDRLYFTYNSIQVSADVSAWVAGTIYCVVFRWDTNNTLDGTNHGSISVDDAHTFADTSVSVNSVGDFRIGSNNGATVGNVIIEGLTVYRRPLFDGTYGIDVGNGDELALIYNSGTGTDATEITGSWDVVFCLPTNSTAGELVTGTGEAWSHPHSSAVLTDTFCETTYGSSAWGTKGTPSTAPADLADADKVYAWGYDWTCDADAEGIEQGLTSLAAGQNYVIRCIAHVDDANDLRIRVTDDTNAADIVTFEFGASSDRDTPGAAIFTWELPTIARNGVGSDCVAMTIAVEGTAASQQVSLHQVEVQGNLVDNPSLETGSGDPWIPDGWTNLNLDAGDTEQELAIVHSGSASMQVNAGATAETMTHSDQWGTIGAFYSVGGWGYDVGGAILRLTATVGTDVFWQARGGFGGSLGLLLDDGSASWNHAHAVIRSANASPTPAMILGGVGYVDDLYSFPLDAVSLTVTPASEANSTETSGLRVDGRDTLTQPVTELTATAGTIRFDYTPRHSSADASKFGQNSAEAVIADINKDGSNLILVYWESANTVRLRVIVGGVTTDDDWDATGVFVAGETYSLIIEYDATECTLKTNDVIVATATPGGGIDFGANVPDSAKWGHDAASIKQVGATFAAPSGITIPASWWDIGSNVPVAVYQPIGADDLADSYINLDNPGTNDAAPGVAPTWASGTGWTFNGTTQYLDSGITPTLSYTILARYNGLGASSGSDTLVGSFTGSGDAFLIQRSATDTRKYFSGSVIEPGEPFGAGGVMAVAGRDGYNNGLLDGTVATGAAPAIDMYVGALNLSGAASQFFDGKIQAVAIYSTTLSADEVKEMTIRMALLQG